MRITARELLSQAPSLSIGVFNANLLRLGEELEDLEQSSIRLLHVDVMDGIFCPQFAGGPQQIRALPERFVKDVHLMIDEPLGKLDAFVDAGADILTVHVESTRHPHRVLQSLRDTGVLRGIAVNPGTPLGLLEPLIDEIELLLVLAVNPGFPGQLFIPATTRRLAEAKTLVAGREIAIAVDGGITSANLADVSSLGIDIIVTGSAIYNTGTPADNLRTAIDAVKHARRSNLDGAKPESRART